jgi:AcrR family transcriptional regulator
MTRQQQRTDETRTRILEAAEKCFAEHGYEGTGVADICQLANLSKGAVYHHFASKHAIFMELLNRWLAGLDEHLLRLSEQHGLVPEEIMALSGVATGVMQDVSRRFPLFLEFWSQAARDVQTWTTTLQPYRRYRDFFAGLIDRGIQEGTLRPQDPQVAARIVMSLAIGLFVQGWLDPQANWEQVTRAGIGLLIGWLQKE